MLIGLAISVLVARSLGPTGKGSFDVAMATAGFLSLGLSLSLPGGIAYAVAGRTADPGAIARFLIPFAAVQATISLVLLYIGSTVAPTLTGDSGGHSITAIAAIVGVSSLAVSLRAVLIGREMIVAASWLDIFGRVIGAIAIVAIVVAAGSIPGVSASYEQMLWASVVATGVLCVMTWVVLRRITEGAAGPRGLRSILRFSLPAHVGNLVQFLNYRLDLFMVTLFAGLAGAGVYALAVSLAQTVWLAPGAIALAVLPRVASERSGGTNKTDVARLSRVSLLISVAASLVLAILGPPFILHVYGSGFAAATFQLLLLLPGVALFGQATVLAAFIGGMGRQRLNMYVGVVALVVTLIFDLALIPAFAGAGAALASSLSYVTTAALTLILAARLGSLEIRELLVPQRADVTDLARGLARLRRT